MQGTRIHLLVGGLLLVTANSIVQAETLQPDPAWQQGKLDNGFSWQVLSTPQRPSDRVELRLMVKTGSLAESSQQVGFAHLLPRIALTHSESFTPPQLRSLWQQSMDSQRPLPPAISSYDFTLYNLSLPNNRPDLLKEALAWLADTTGRLAIDEQTVQSVLNAAVDPVVTFPPNPKDPWWRYRLKGSTLLAHEPGQTLQQPVDLAQLKKFYQQWYTPDAMTLYVVGKVDSRSLSEQINKTFSPLQGKREIPATMPTLLPLLPQPVSLVSEQAQQDTLSIIWDQPWHPIHDSQGLSRYWSSDLAREALFWHIQQVLQKSAQKDVQLGFDCRVQYQQAQCAIHLNAPDGKLNTGLAFVARELAAIRNKGLSADEFNALLAQKNEQLGQLFATYARTDTDVLMSQRLRSQQSGVVDIAPEQYQKLRQAFLAEVTLGSLNQELKLLLSQDATLVLMQQQGKPEMNMQQLQAAYNQIMALPAAVATEEHPVAEGRVPEIDMP